MTTTPLETENTNTASIEQIDEVGRRDELFGIQEVDIEDTLLEFPLVRSNGQTERGWLLVGTGINPKSGREVGKFEKNIFNDNGDLVEKNYNYRDLEEQYLLLEKLKEEGHGERVASLLSRPAVEPSVEIVLDAAESEYAYLKDYLPPVVRPDVPKSVKSYDYLFDPNYNPAEYLQRQKTPDEKLAEYYDKFVTDENRAASVDTLKQAMLHNPKINEFLRESGIDPHSVEAVDAIRENPEVRFKVAEYLAAKLDMKASLYPDEYGERVVNNSPGNQKVDSQTAKRMPSRVYAVGLALKMIDGEFSEKNAASDFERNDQGRPIIGQHRHAARSILLGR